MQYPRWRRAGGGGFDEPSLWMGNTWTTKDELQNPLLLPSSINRGMGEELAAHVLTPHQITRTQGTTHSLVGPHALKKSLSAKAIRGARNSCSLSSSKSLEQRVRTSILMNSVRTRMSHVSITVVREAFIWSTFD
ncbi:hypothetical protein EJB05_01618 [Eragrostis curvula]|uniref:Uncharacterized protein n=1 Tax=Eragrostis curvula TaxID=38414 RepID=A0A5J9WNF6_9POAL|nr:hypothetical protein EJB05_01618 [Eragrostis curvula]